MSIGVQRSCQARLGRQFSIILEVIKDLAWAQVQIRVVRRLILEFELDVVYCGAIIFLAVLDPVSRASLNGASNMRLVCLDKAYETITHIVTVFDR